MKLGEKHGQSLILLALSLVGLLAMAGLGIDGGRLFSAKRRAQNAADAAAMAAALVIAQQQDGVVSAADIQQAKAAAIQRAADNGFSLPADDVTITPKDDYYYVDVHLSVAIPPTLIGVVYHGPLAAQAAAQVRVRPHQNIAYGYAVAATNPHRCNTIKISISDSVTVESGGMFSNSDATARRTCYAIYKTGSGDVRADTIRTVATGVHVYKEVGSGSISPIPQGGYPPMTLPTLPEPACTGPSRSDGGSVLLPGNYSEIRINARDVTFRPGIYCIDGRFQISGVSHVTGENVFFYVRSGDITITGNGDITLKAAVPGSDITRDANGNDWGGMLFYLPPSSDGQVEVHGSSADVYRGTIYAPGPSPSVGTYKCIFTGSDDVEPDVAEKLQLVCDTIHVTGSSHLLFRYDPTYFYGRPPLLDVTK